MFNKLNVKINILDEIQVIITGGQFNFFERKKRNRRLFKYAQHINLSKLKEKKEIFSIRTIFINYFE